MGYKINYTGVDNSDALEHWKYIKRERVGGKWRYWYESPSGKVIGNKPTASEKVKKDVDYVKNEVKTYVNSTDDEREKKAKRQETRKEIDSKINKGVDYVNDFLEKNSSKSADKNGSFINSMKEKFSEVKEIFSSKKETSTTTSTPKTSTNTAKPKVNNTNSSKPAVRDASPEAAAEIQKLIDKKKKKDARKAKLRNFLNKIFN